MKWCFLKESFIQLIFTSQKHNHFLARNIEISIQIRWIEFIKENKWCAATNKERCRSFIKKKEKMRNNRRKTERNEKCWRLPANVQWEEQLVEGGTGCRGWWWWSRSSCSCVAKPQRTCRIQSRVSWRCRVSETRGWGWWRGRMQARLPDWWLPPCCGSWWCSKWCPGWWWTTGQLLLRWWFLLRPMCWSPASLEPTYMPQAQGTTCHHRDTGWGLAECRWYRLRDQRCQGWECTDSSECDGPSCLRCKDLLESLIRPASYVGPEATDRPWCRNFNVNFFHLSNFWCFATEDR